MKEKEIKPWNIKNLFSDDVKYIIPIYQRNFAWSNAEITQLIQDIYDFATDSNKSTKKYYIGTLVVFKKISVDEIVYETIDGQQRLTSLNIILNAIKNELAKKGSDTKFFSIYDNINQWYKDINLKFSVREKSTKTLNAIFKDQCYGHEKYDIYIEQAYKDSKKYLNELFNGFKDFEAFNNFYNFLIENVLILRVEVPEDTDLNQYFEVMNNRGEQLEKQEILKSRLIEILNKEDENSHELEKTFNHIWNACSNMNKYVQYGFKSQYRYDLFGKNWNDFHLNDFDSINKIISAKDNNESNQSQIKSLKDIIEYNKHPEPPENKSKDEIDDRFNSVINFSNFLLQVLRIQTKEDVSLDDKRLLDIFDEYIEDSSNEIEFAKKFGYNLLKCKFLFDKYIIKREYIENKDQWSLKTLYHKGKDITYYKNSFDDESLNKDLVMILSMFRVSFPRMSYNHWLSASLYYLFKENVDSIDSNIYKEYLEELAKSFLFKISLNENPTTYFELIYKNDKKQLNIENISYEYLDNGTKVEIFVFNYLDYLLWKKDKKDEKSKNKYSKFEFTFRSSVEHFYPQKQRGTLPEIGGEEVNNFGNLCLISSSRNSELSNKSPELKRVHHEENHLKMESIKQCKMFEIQKKEGWNTEQIKRHGNEMKEVFKSLLND